MTATPETRSLEPEYLEDVVIRFAGDSGDGMQLTGDRFTDVSAVFGNDLATMPNYPAEIRAPAGTIAGVSSFQVHISDHEILTPGDMPHVLIAMNPAALRANIAELAPGGTLLVNSDTFEDRNLTKAGYEVSPLEDGSLSAYHLLQVPMTTITLECTKELGVNILISEDTYNLVKDTCKAHAVKEITVKGRKQPVMTYAVDAGDGVEGSAKKDAEKDA